MLGEVKLCLKVRGFSALGVEQPAAAQSKIAAANRPSARVFMWNLLDHSIIRCADPRKSKS